MGSSCTQVPSGHLHRTPVSLLEGAQLAQVGPSKWWMFRFCCVILDSEPIVFIIVISLWKYFHGFLCSGAGMDPSFLTSTFFNRVSSVF